MIWGGRLGFVTDIGVVCMECVYLSFAHDPDFPGQAPSSYICRHKQQFILIAVHFCDFPLLLKLLGISGREALNGLKLLIWTLVEGKVPGNVTCFKWFSLGDIGDAHYINISQHANFCSAGQHGYRRASSFPKVASHGLLHGWPQVVIHVLCATSSSLVVSKTSTTSSSRVWYDDQHKWTDLPNVSILYLVLIKKQDVPLVMPGFLSEGLVTTLTFLRTLQGAIPQARIVSGNRCLFRRRQERFSEARNGNFADVYKTWLGSHMPSRVKGRHPWLSVSPWHNVTGHTPGQSPLVALRPFVTMWGKGKGLRILMG